MSYKVLLPQEIMPAARAYLETRGYELIDGSGKEEADIIKDIPDADAIIVRLSKMSRKVFEAAKKLKVVARHGAGYDSVDLQAAKDHNVMVTYAPIANSMSVAETTIFYMLYLSRNFKKVQKTFVDDYYGAKLKLPKVQLYGKKLGLVGIGNIGSRVAKIAHHGFDMEILAYDPFVKKELVTDYIKLTDDLELLFKESDFISLHLPSNKETNYTIDKHYFDLIRPNAYFINCSRGKIVNEADLYESLRAERFAGAALDVLVEEPVDASNPLLTLDNIVIGPHIGAATKEATERASLHCAIGIDEVLSGKDPTWPIPEFKDFKVQTIK